MKNREEKDKSILAEVKAEEKVIGGSFKYITCINSLKHETQMHKASRSTDYTDFLAAESYRYQ